MFDMQKVGRRISDMRKRANLTQSELADRLGISFQAVSNWERGNSCPDISKLSELSQILNCTIDELLGNRRAAELSPHQERAQTNATRLMFDELAQLADQLATYNRNR